LLSETNH